MKKLVLLFALLLTACTNPTQELNKDVPNPIGAFRCDHGGGDVLDLHLEEGTSTARLNGNFMTIEVERHEGDIFKFKELHDSSDDPDYLYFRYSPDVPKLISLSESLQESGYECHPFDSEAEGRAEYEQNKASALENNLPYGAYICADDEEEWKFITMDLLDANVEENTTGVIFFPEEGVKFAKVAYTENRAIVFMLDDLTDSWGFSYEKETDALESLDGRFSNSCKIDD